MKTRFWRNFVLPSLGLGTVSAALIGVLRLGLPQQNSVKHATADSALTPSNHTAIRGGKDGPADKAGSSQKSFQSMATVRSVIPGCPETQAMEEAFANARITIGRWLARQLNQGELSKGKPQIYLDETTKYHFEYRLEKLQLTPQERCFVFDTKEYETFGSFDVFDVESKPNSESTVVETTGDASKLRVLFTDLELDTLRSRGKHPNDEVLYINKPMTMLSMFRPYFGFRLVACPLPYPLAEIASGFTLYNQNYTWRINDAVPKMQANKPSPVPFICISSGQGYLNIVKVKLNDKTAVVKRHFGNNTFPQDSNTTDLPQSMQKLKLLAKIPDTHKLVIGYCRLTRHSSSDEPNVFLCSDLKLIDDLCKEKELTESANNFDNSNATVNQISAFYVHRKYAPIMEKYVLGTFQMLQTSRFLDDTLKVESESLLNTLREKALEVASPESCCTVM